MGRSGATSAFRNDPMHIQVSIPALCLRDHTGHLFASGYSDLSQSLLLNYAVPCPLSGLFSSLYVFADISIIFVHNADR